MPHFHVFGWMSSAYYARLPGGGEQERKRHEGWIEFGRPPAMYGLELEPRRIVEPKVGRLVLFPSYMFHGTVPFGGQGRPVDRRIRLSAGLGGRILAAVFVRGLMTSSRSPPPVRPVSSLTNPTALRASDRAGVGRAKKGGGELLPRRPKLVRESFDYIFTFAWMVK